MRSFKARRTLASLSMAGSALVLALGVSGCGGASDSGNAVVVPEPGVNVAAAPSGGAATPAPSSGAAAPAAATPAPAAAAAPVKAEGWGTLKGTITFGGTPAAPEVLIAKGEAPKDPTVCAKDEPVINEKLLVDGESKGVRNVLVYLVKPTAINDEAKAAASKAELIFDQKNCVFLPHVLGVMSGATITLKSSDPVNHNVNARMKSNAPFNSLLAGGQTMPFSPASSERQPAPVTCDIHPWMQAWWMVLDHPYFATTDAKGLYEIKNAPAGTQKVVVWQEATGFLTATQGEDVNIAPNGTTTKDFTVDPSKVKK